MFGFSLYRMCYFLHFSIVCNQILSSVSKNWSSQVLFLNICRKICNRAKNRLKCWRIAEMSSYAFWAQVWTHAPSRCFSDMPKNGENEILSSNGPFFLKKKKKHLENVVEWEYAVYREWNPYQSKLWSLLAFLSIHFIKTCCVHKRARIPTF